MIKTIEQKALKFMDQNHLFIKGDKVLVALSGGADSVFLLSFLVKFKNRFKIDIAAFHLNHKLRGVKAKADEKFCSDLCKEYGVRFFHLTKDVKAFAKKNKISIEEAGREIRYRELNIAAKKLGFNKIGTAHNASDNAETVLMNFVKGSGLKGLSGIPVRRDNIIRPVLALTANEIRTYLNKNKISYRVDETNLESEYERNFLRNKIIPLLKSRLNPKIEEKINNTSMLVSGINTFIESKLKNISKKIVSVGEDKISFKLKELNKIDKTFSSILLKTSIDKKFNTELSYDNIHSLFDLLNSQTGRRIVLKEDIVSVRERNELVFLKNISPVREDTVHKIKIDQRLKFGNNILSIIKVNRKMIKFTQNKSVEFISGDSLKDKFEVRRWKHGDKFHPIGMKGTKKVSDFLSDEKISSTNKKEQLVLTNSGKILWVIGLRIDERFKINPDTKKILKLALVKK